MEKVMGIFSPRNCLARGRLYPMSSIIRDILGWGRGLSHCPVKANAFEKLLMPSKLPVTKQALLHKKPLLFIWSSFFS
jgi:hypothetical protein